MRGLAAVAMLFGATLGLAAPSPGLAGAADGLLAPTSSKPWSWQNPALGPNPWNNIHNDSWFTDTYPVAGPTSARRVRVEVISRVTFDDPTSGESVTVRLGECAAHTYDTDGNLLTVCAGFPDPAANSFKRSIIALSPDNEILAYRSFDDPIESLREALTDFSGAGYFYLDHKERVVLAMPDGHVVVWQREPSPVSDVDRWVPARNINVAGEGGVLPSDLGDLYALVPNEDGFIWFTTVAGVVGTIAPEPCVDDCIKWIDVNDPDGDGVRTPQADGGLQTITESHSVNRKSTFQQTNYSMYRFDIEADGTPVIAWQAPYDRGSQIKPGQTSQGSGTSPVYFEIDGRGFVTLMDNAEKPNINVYRAETGPGESRLFAQAAPFGSDAKVSDENSLIVFPGRRPGTIRIYSENNWANVRLISTAGPLVTRPGFGGIEVSHRGDVRVLPNNRRIRVPSVVSKGSIPSYALYTYNKRASGWYLTALDPDRPSRVLWTVQVGSGSPRYNNWYAQLSLAPAPDTFFIGSVVGLIKVTMIDGRPLPAVCYSILEPSDFIDTMISLAEYSDESLFYGEYLRAAFVGWHDDLSKLQRLGPFAVSQLQVLMDDVTRAELLLAQANYYASSLDGADQAMLSVIAANHDALLQAAEVYYQKNCT